MIYHAIDYCFCAVVCRGVPFLLRCGGVIRDLDGIKKVGFPVYATGEVAGHGRFVVKSFQVGAVCCECVL